MQTTASIALLSKLVAFDTTSYKSNLELIYYIQNCLESHQIQVTLHFNAEQNKANLLASVGPLNQAGILLSGHTDVVPVAGQAWDSNPFEARIQDDKILGRGTADMKGFVACAVVAMIEASKKQLLKPLHLCLSYDEEIGCIGVRGILDHLAATLYPPLMCIIGEPTSMNIATGHKGKSVFKAICQGQEGHSALAPNYTNAIHVASSVIQTIIQTQSQIAQTGSKDLSYDIPYTTLHIGKIDGGKALNIVPNQCIVDYEIRNIAQDHVETIQDQILDQLHQCHLPQFIHIEAVNQYPGLNTSPTVQAVKFLQHLLPDDRDVRKISFGTEGGLFTHSLGCPVLVCGPGSIDVAHKPNEFIEIEQMQKCDQFLSHLVQQLCI